MVEREIPDPRSAAGSPQSSSLRVVPQRLADEGGHWPGIKYPRVPGHEIAGVSIGVLDC